MSLAEIVQSSGWKSFMSKLYGIGASVVIIGALFKIQHYPAAGLLLFIGLCTEATIFFFSAFEPLHEEPDWSLVYPELSGVTDDGELGPRIPPSAHTGAIPGGSAALARFDEMLAGAEITPDVFESLGQGLKKLNATTANMNAMGDVSVATREFADKVKGAANTFGRHSEEYAKSTQELGNSLGQLDESYRKTAGIINETGSNYKNMTESLGKVELTSSSYQEQMATMNKNLSALNAVYELQLKNTSNQVKETGELLTGVQSMLANLNDSAQDAQKYREQVSKLSENLTALNNVYGNMLSAMNIK
ncbi:MAG: gliding motility protein GldL [Bacteroidales bacterium]|nr:gliding motility protein GldL [Bacteroidales bacterium]